MYGINWVTLLGRVVDDPIPVRERGCDGVAFRLDASASDIDRIGVWCYSFAEALNHTKEFDIKKDQYVVFHGALVGPSKACRQQLGVPWKLCLHGRVYASMTCAEFKTGPVNHLAPIVITGMIVPGYRTHTSKAGNEFIYFTMHNETEMIWFRQRVLFQQTVFGRVLSIADTPEIVKPGAIVLCRGHLLQYPTTGQVAMHVWQIESLGVVQSRLVERYTNKPMTFPKGFDPRPRVESESRNG